MSVAIMQPYFFPHLDHFRLMAAADRWIVFDTVVYRRKTWMNRNRTINRDTGWGYISVPVNGAGRDEIVSNITIADHLRWRDTLLGKLRVYESEAPHYSNILSLVELVLAPPHTHLTGLNVAGLKAIRDAIGITTPITQLSAMGLHLPSEIGPGEWALRICEAIGANSYVNPAGGRDLFDNTQFAAAGVDLNFLEPSTVTYATGTFEFEPGLSIIDTLMWLGREKTAALLIDPQPAK